MEMALPKLYRVRQTFPAPEVKDIPGTIATELGRARFKERVRPGGRIAVAVGSRGVARIDRICRAVVEALRDRGYSPIIVPAMGSHGGGTARGQEEVLAGYGITEATMGAPVVASMEVVELGRTDEGDPVYFDRVAGQCDGIVAINRVKAHTDFRGRWESGVLKMLVIGLGNDAGAQVIHRHGTRGLRECIPKAARVILANAPFILGFGIVENAYEQPAEIRAMTPEEIWEIEAELLIKAKSLAARLPFARAELLIVDELGKNISGSGMDTNVLGRMAIETEPDPERPKIRRIVVLDVTPESHGNAIGIGLADYTTLKLLQKIDWKPFLNNTWASAFHERSKIAVPMETEQRAILAALRSCWDVPGERARVARIRNTLEITELFVSEALLSELDTDHPVEIVSGPWEMEFSPEGDLVKTGPHSLGGEHQA